MPESTPPSSLLERDALAAKYAAQQAEAWRRYKDILRPLQTLQPMLADLLDAPPGWGSWPRRRGTRWTGLMLLAPNLSSC